jgi:hypothetical protein
MVSGRERGRERERESKVDDQPEVSLSLPWFSQSLSSRCVPSIFDPTSMRLFTYMCASRFESSPDRW